jgi:uncharacterized iron-regulated membrane protein
MSKLLRPKRKNESYFNYIMSVSHLWLGLLTSVILIITCISGCLYAFKNQIEDFSNRHTIYTVSTGTSQFPIDSLVAKFESRYGKMTRIVLPESGSDRAVQLSAGERGASITACYNANTGDFIGLKGNSTDGFFSFVLDLHRNLLLGEAGKMIVGVAVLGFLVLLLSGLVLWFPKKLKQIKKGLTVKLKAKFYRLNYDLHNVLGFYSTVLLLFIALTGLYVSFSWVKNAMIVGLGGESIVITADNSELKAKLADSFNSLLNAVATSKPTEEAVSLETILEKTNQLYPEKGTTVISVANDELKIVSVLKYDRNNWLNFYVPNKAEFNQQGNLMKELRYANLPLHKQFMAVAKPLHTGEIMGLGSIIVYFIVSLIGASLPVTGFIIWWKKGSTGSKKSKKRNSDKRACVKVDNVLY